MSQQEKKKTNKRLTPAHKKAAQAARTNRNRINRQKRAERRANRRAQKGLGEWKPYGSLARKEGYISEGDRKRRARRITRRLTERLKNQPQAA